MVLVRLLRQTSDNNCALCDKSVKLATFEGLQMLNNSVYGGIAESTYIWNTARVMKNAESAFLFEQSLLICLPYLSMNMSSIIFM